MRSAASARPDVRASGGFFRFVLFAGSLVVLSGCGPLIGVGVIGAVAAQPGSGHGGGTVPPEPGPAPVPIESFSPANEGLNGGIVTAVGLHAGAPELMYAATADGDLFRSSNAGATWTAIARPAPVWRILRITPSPTRAGRVFVIGTNGFEVYRSDDAGDDWVRINVLGQQVTAIGVDPVDPDLVYAGHRGTVYRSTDGGATWTGPFFTGISGGDPFGGFATDSRLPGTVFALVRGASGGISRSDDEGIMWTPTATATSMGWIRTLAFDPFDVQTLYAGGATFRVRKSVDGGSTWADAAAGLPAGDVNDLVALGTPGALLAATQNGLYRSTDAAATWAPVTATFSAREAFTLAADPSQPSRAFVAVYAGLFATSDGGASLAESDRGIQALHVPLSRSIRSPSLPPRFTRARSSAGSSRAPTRARAGRLSGRPSSRDPSRRS